MLSAFGLQRRRFWQPLVSCKSLEHTLLSLYLPFSHCLILSLSPSPLYLFPVRSLAHSPPVSPLPLPRPLSLPSYRLFYLSLSISLAFSPSFHPLSLPSPLSPFRPFSPSPVHFLSLSLSPSLTLFPSHSPIISLTLLFPLSLVWFPCVLLWLCCDLPIFFLFILHHDRCSRTA